MNLSTMNPSLLFTGRPYLGHRPVVRLATALLVLGLAACSSTSESGREIGGEGAEGSGGGGEGSEGAGHGGAGGSGEGNEGAGTGGEESNAQYDLTHTYDMVESNGARLVLSYDKANKRFTGTVTNTTGATLRDVRVEIHLGPNRSETNEIGPTPWMDLAPGESMVVSLGAAGLNFSQYSVHVEDGPRSTPSALPDPGTDTFSLLGPWAVKGGVDLGLEHQGHGLGAWYTRQGNSWTPHLTPAAPEHQPTGAATWAGEWAGYYGTDPAIKTGAASVTVRLGAATEADLELRNVPNLGTLQWDAMTVTDGRFSGSTAAGSGTYDAVGQFGGIGQAGVAGHASGQDFRSVFYGDKQ